MGADGAIILPRLAQYLATAVLFGTPLFCLYTRGLARPVPGWVWRAAVVAAVLGLAATVAWTMAQTVMMVGETAAALDARALSAVLTETPFGQAALVRAAAIAAALVVLAARPRLDAGACAAVVGLGGIAAASLAWGGHGAAGEGMASTIHTLADVLHLLAASVWLGALLAFVVLAFRTRGHSPDTLDTAHRALVGFAGVGTATVAVLLLTGAVNSWFLIGPDDIGALFTTRYGQLLAIKLALFGLMLGLAAANRYRLVPALTRPQASAVAIARVRRSLAMETALGVAVIALVGWLGTLVPPGEG